MTCTRFVFVLLVLAMTAALSAAQPAELDDRPGPAVELAVGYAGFVDDATIGKGSSEGPSRPAAGRAFASPTARTARPTSASAGSRTIA